MENPHELTIPVSIEYNLSQYRQFALYICSTTIHIYKKVLSNIINVNSNTIIIKQVFFFRKSKKNIF